MKNGGVDTFLDGKYRELVLPALFIVLGLLLTIGSMNPTSNTEAIGLWARLAATSVVGLQGLLAFLLVLFV